VQLPVTVITDFSVSSSTSTQTVTAGQTSGAYQLAIMPNPPGSSFNAAVTLSCTAGLPAQAQCIFNPSTPITPGSSASGVDVVMNISTTASSADIRLRTQATASTSARTGAGTRTSVRASNSTFLYGPWLLLPGIVIGSGLAGTRRGAKRGQRLLGWMITLVLLALFLSLSLSLPSCGGVSNGGGSGTTGTPVTYIVTITGTSGVLSHSTQVTLVVD
jgi:hypothetical protein